MADHLPRRVSVQAAIAAGLLVAGLLLIARPSSQSAVVTTQFETVAHSKLSKYEVEDFTSTTFVSGPSNTFLPPSCNYSLNITGATADTGVKGLCQIANTNTRCCTYNPIPADTTGCTTACAQRYISFFCYSACNTQFPANQTCSQPIIDLYNACANQASCKVLGAGNGQGAAFWAAANGITLSSPSNTNCTSNFTAVDVVPCGQSSVPTFQSNLPIIAHFTTSDANVPEFVYPGEFTSSNPLQISSAERFGVLFTVNNHVVTGACSPTTPPVKAVITVTLTPVSSTTPILLGNFTVYSPWFSQNTTAGATGFFDADTTKNDPEADLVQLDPTEGSGLVTITVVVYNFQGASAANSTSFYIQGNTPTGQNSLILPNGQTYSPNTQAGTVTLSNLTLLGDNTIDGRGSSNALIVHQISFPDNTTAQDSVTFKNVIVNANNITFGSGGLSNAIYLINSTLTITGGNNKYQTSFDSAQLCICGDSSSKVIFASTSVFDIVTGNSQNSGNNNLVFCGQLTAIIQSNAIIQVTQTAFAPTSDFGSAEGIGVIDGASLINSGTINLNDGSLVIYTTGQFINNGTITALNNTRTSSTTPPYTSIFLISGNFNETVNGESIGVNRTSGPAPSPTFLQPWTTCEPGLTIIRVTTIQLCGTNSTNVTVGSGVVAVVGNEDTCDVGATFNGTEIVAEVYNLEVLNGGEVEFDNINGNDGLLVVLGAAHWQAGSTVKVDLDSSVNAEQVFIPLMVCINTADPTQCCSPAPSLVLSQQNGITQTIVCLSFGQPGYPFNNTAHKFETKLTGVTHPATMGVVLSQTVQAAPSQVNTPRYVSGNTYCVELNENPSQFPQSTFLAYVSNTLGIAQNLVNIIVYGTDAATGYLKVQFSCRDFYSAANADNTCTNIYNQALGTGTFNSQVQGIQQCGIATNAPPSKDHSNNALFALFALAAIPLLICFCVIILCLNKKRQADNQYMQDTATFSNVASSPQNVAYAAPSDKYYPSYPTPTPIGYYP